MPEVRSGTLAAWSAAWLAGRVSLDEVVDAVTGSDTPHHVADLPGTDGAPTHVHDLLVAWRRTGGPVLAVLPVPGDVRGLPGPAAFRTAALDAGEAAFAPGLGVVPEVVSFTPSSAPPTVLWRAFPIDPAPHDPLPLGEAQYELTMAIRESASALSAADVAGAVADIADALHDARRAGEYLNLPPGFPPRAVALLAQAERMRAVLDLAGSDPAGGAVDQHGIRARDQALRPLAAAVRRARVAGYNAAAASG